MADLSFKNRWSSIIPDILGNRDDPTPFRLQVRRLTRGELDRFRELADEVRRSGGKALAIPIARMTDLFDGVVRGPFGPLTIDGRQVPEGELGSLLELAAVEFPFAGCIFDGLVESVLLVNELSEVAEGNSERRRGGDGSTPPETEDAGSPHPEDAPPADAPSSAASTSSGETPTASRG